MMNNTPAAANMDRRTRSKSVAAILTKLVGPEPKDVAELVDKMLGDYQVQLCELTITALMKTVPITIGCDDAGEYASELDAERAEVLSDWLRSLWDSRVSDMLKCYRYGRVAFEKVWGFDRATGLQYLEDIEPLPFKETTLELDEEGHFAGITLRVGTGDEADKIELEPVKSWWLAIDATAIEPHGRSRFLGAPQEVWTARRKLFKLREIFMNRCVLKGGVAHIPMSTTIDDNGVASDDSTNVERAFEDYVAGGLMLFPNDRDIDTKQYKYDIQMPEGLNDPAPLDATIDGSDVEQTRAFGIPEKTIMEGDAVGSFAMVSLQMLVLYAVVDDILGQIVSSFQCYIIDKAVELNFPDGAQPSITIKAPKLARQSDSMVVDIVKSMLTSQTLSPLVMSGAVDVLAMLEGLDIPISPEAYETIAGLVAKFQSAPLPGVVPAPGATPGGSSSPSVESGVPPQPPDAGGVPLGSAAVNLSNNPAPVESASLSRVPTLDELADEAVAESDLIWKQIQKVLARMHATHTLEGSVELQRLLDELRQLRADLETAGKLLGMVSLWKPTVNSVPDGFGQLQQTANLSNTGSRSLVTVSSENQPIEIHIDPLDASYMVVPHTVTLALPGTAGGSVFGEGPPEGSRIRFKFVEQAAAWVVAKQLATASDVSQMARADKLKVFTAPRIDDIPTLQQLRQQVSDSLATGESLYNFRKKLSDDLQLKRHEVETLYRTNTKQAYDDGLNKTLEKPHINERFGYVLYVATQDNRVRSSHWELNELVAKVGSPLHKIFLAARADWNCRCGLIPLTYEQAKARGVSSINDLADEVSAKYADAI